MRETTAPRYAESQVGPTTAWPAVAGGLVERLALAMAAAEGNEEAQERALRGNYDYMGYGDLALAAVGELERLGLLPGPATADTATGAAGKP